MIRIKTEIMFFYKIHNPLKPNIHNISLWCLYSCTIQLSKSNVNYWYSLICSTSELCGYYLNFVNMWDVKTATYHSDFQGRFTKTVILVQKLLRDTWLLLLFNHKTWLKINFKATEYKQLLLTICAMYT